MSAPCHLLVRASAGTGKTYQLTSRYLALVLGGADPDRVLATTFTRKAAHEILERVLARLAEAAKPTDRGRAELAELSKATGREVSGEECLAALERLLRGMDRVRIGTIDSFFVQIARLFALDLGLPPGWRIADEAEADALRSEAVAEAMAGAGKLEMLDLLRDLARQSVGQSAHGELLRFAQKGREALLESAPEAWTRIHRLPDAGAEKIAKAVAALPMLAVPRNKSGKSAGSEKKRWAAAKARLVDLVARGDWIGVLEVGLVTKILEGEVEFDRSPIEREHLQVLRPIIDRALHLATERLEIQNGASRSLLERYEEKWRALTRGSGLLRFEDLPDALAPVGGGPLGALGAGEAFGGHGAGDPLAARGVDLAHRLDGRIDHLLLDEFQDTAPVQWRALRTLAESILADGSGGRSFFCVGDEKQSIYGWRAAEPRLLRELGAKRPGLACAELHESQRSSRAVLGAVNAVFGSIAGNPAFEGEDAEVIAAAAEFQGPFKAHAPAARHRDRPGAAFLVRARVAKEGEAVHAPAMEAAVERVSAILSDAPRASVGVLLRRRRWIPELIHALREEGIAASDEGGNPLTDSVAVLHALSLLHLADHPGDSAAAFHVATSPLGRRVGLEAGLFAERAKELRSSGSSPDLALPRACAVASEVRAKLADLGYGGFLASIRPGDGGDYGEWDLGRYGQLVDLALAWQGRAGSRPSAFVEHARRTKVEDRSAAQVRVMTVHGAKGLQFDAVVLPELDRSMKVGEQGLLTLRPDPEGPIELVTHGVAKGIARAHGELEKVRADVVRRGMVEELCVMYVAMTRAVHRIDLIVQGREKEGGGLTSAAILRGALGVDASGEAGEAWRSPEGTERWWREEIGPAAPAGAQEAALASTDGRKPLRLAPSRRSREPQAMSPSHLKDIGPVRSSTLLLPHDAMTVRGRIVHRLLQEVEWIETFDRSDEELMAIGRRIAADEGILVSALIEFRAALSQPGMRRLLSRPEEQAEVWRERPFNLLMPEPTGSPSLWSGAFDRLVVLHRGRARAAAEVIDFKTDRVQGDTLGERAESYGQQMKAYRRAAARITNLPEDSIRTRLAFIVPDVVLDA